MVIKFKKSKLLVGVLMLLHGMTLVGINFIIPVAVLSICYGAAHFKNIIETDYESKPVILAGIAVAFASVIVCYVRYGQSLIQGMVGIYFIFILLSYFIFYDYFCLYDDGIWTAMKLIIRIAVCIAILAIAQSLLYPYFNLFEYAFRNDRIRIYEIELSFFAEIIAFSHLILGLATKTMKIQLVIMLWGLVFVSQSRGAMIVLCASGTIAVIRKYWNDRTIRSFLKNLLFLMLLACGVYLFSKTAYWDFLFSFFDEIQEGMGSGATRLGELFYYFKELRKSPWFGMGILKGGSLLADRVYRIDLWFFIEDCGLLGYIFQTGITGILWLISVFLCMLARIKKLMRTETREGKVILNSMIMVIIASAVGIANANHIVSRTSILFFSMLLAMADVCLKKETEVTHEV